MNSEGITERVKAVMEGVDVKHVERYIKWI